MAHDPLVVEVHKEDERGNVYTLREPIRWWSGLTVPAGFQSDGASVPRFFWRVVFPPGDSRALFAAFIHDYIYRTHPRGWSKEDADDAFRDLLLQDGIPAVRTNLAYWGVRLFGGPAWRAGDKYEC